MLSFLDAVKSTLELYILLVNVSRPLLQLKISIINFVLKYAHFTNLVLRILLKHSRSTSSKSGMTGFPQILNIFLHNFQPF